MIPGTTSKISESVIASAATIYPKTDLIRVSGTTSVSTIVPPYSGFSGILLVVATDAAGFATLTTGNIALAVSLTTSKVVAFVYSKLAGAWYPGAIS